MISKLTMDITLLIFFCMILYADKSCLYTIEGVNNIKVKKVVINVEKMERKIKF